MTHPVLPSHTVDVLIIGAGVVGCAMARQFALQGADVLVVEKAADILEGASKGNSAILHTGFDAPPGSIEQQCVAKGYAQYHAIRESLGLPLLHSGAHILAFTGEQQERLPSIVAQAHQNGVHDVDLISRDTLLSREPAVDSNVVAAVEIPGESLIDPWSAPLAYIKQALENGATVVRQCAVEGGVFDGTSWTIETNRGQVTARSIISCAGLYGDHVDQLLKGSQDFSIRPRRGQFLVYDSPARHLVNSILLPVPTETTKGVVVCRTIFGKLLVGPTAEEQQSRSNASVEHQTLLELKAEGERIVPGLLQQSVIGVYAGIRPATENKDYQISADKRMQYISVGGIRSTGLSAALGIAEYVWERYTDWGKTHSAPEAARAVSVPMLSDYDERDWQQQEAGPLVCYCELVTRREIEQALEGPLPATTPGGLKRRTRAMMGRCQGFNCLAGLAELTAGKLDPELAGALSDD